MGFDKELGEAVALFAVMAVLRIVVDWATCDKDLSFFVLMIRMIPGILGIGLIVYDALSLKTVAAWVSWFIVTIIMFQVTHDWLEPLITVVLAVLIGAGRFYYDSNN